MNNKNLVPLSILLMLIGLFNAKVEGAPITFNTALPVSEGEFILREQILLVESSNNPSADGLATKIERKENTLISTLVYGLTPDLTLFATIPITNRQLKSTNLSTFESTKRESSGMGDVSFVTRYTVYKNDFKGGSFRIAPFVGIKLGTGNDDATDELGVLPANVQNGSGTNDTFIGLVATYASVDWEWDGQISYVDNESKGNLQRGNFLKLDMSLQYRFYPNQLSANTDTFINGVIEINHSNQQKSRIEGASIESSGGLINFISPGIQWVTERLILEASIQLPIRQPERVTGLEIDYIFRAGFRLNF